MRKDWRRMVVAASAMLLLGAVTYAHPQGKKDCLSYEPAVVKLTGKITRQTYPGPPNYENVDKGDTPETYWFLELDDAVCVDEDKKTPDLNPAQRDVRKMQLVFEDETAYTKYKELFGKKVVAMGTLFGAHTAHHHTDVLLWVKNMERAK